MPALALFSYSVSLRFPFSAIGGGRLRSNKTLHRMLNAAAFSHL
jgi:hypothetical protein